MIQEESVNANRLARLRVVAWINVTVLSAQFLFGMWLNLFVSFPLLLPSLAGMMNSMMGFMLADGMPILMVHMFLGYLLLITSVIAIGIASYSGETRAVILGGLGFISIVVAGVGGLSFMFSGFRDNSFSYVMAIGFLSAFMVYSAVLVIAKSPR